MASYRSVARKLMNERGPWGRLLEVNLATIAILEIAYAISRGRKPNSISVLPEVNVRKFLQEAYNEERNDCYDMDGEPCTIVTHIETNLWEHQPLDGFTDEQNKIFQAIVYVWKHAVKPVKIPEYCRGDREYQARNPNSRLNRKKQRQQDYVMNLSSGAEIDWPEEVAA